MFISTDFYEVVKSIVLHNFAFTNLNNKNI